LQKFIIILFFTVYPKEVYIALAIRENKSNLNAKGYSSWFRAPRFTEGGQIEPSLFTETPLEIMELYTLYFIEFCI
jgi:hypothetical protein